MTHTKDSPDIKVDKYGQSILSGDDLKSLILQGKNINRLCVDGDDRDVTLFLQYQSELIDRDINLLLPVDSDTSFDEFHKQKSNEWIFPKAYQSIDVLDWLLKKCKTQQEKDRVELEYTLFQERDLIMLLRLFIFLVDYMRANKFVWGVGRGSSVASYILFLIGVHRVNSIFYNLDIRDYLK